MGDKERSEQETLRARARVHTRTSRKALIFSFSSSVYVRGTISMSGDGFVRMRDVVLCVGAGDMGSSRGEHEKMDRRGQRQDSGRLFGVIAWTSNLLSKPDSMPSAADTP